MPSRRTIWLAFTLCRQANSVLRRRRPILRKANTTPGAGASAVDELTQCCDTILVCRTDVQGELRRRERLVSRREPTQPLTYALRLPDASQADALRLLDTCKQIINQALAA